jgi:uncharacterized membrane protein YebE (DUF533 family)
MRRMSEEENTKLGRDVFMALAAVGWADGKLDEEEADAIVRCAVDEGLDLDQIGEIEAATKSPVSLESIDRSGMTKADRLFVYAVAAWMTRLDGTRDDSEVLALASLGAALSIPEAPRGHADRIAQEIADLPEGDRPSRYDLAKLRDTLKLRLEEARRAKLLGE